METQNGFPKTRAERTFVTREASLPSLPAQSYQSPELHEIGSLDQIQGLFPQYNVDRLNGFRQV